MHNHPGFSPIESFIRDNHCFACGDRNPFGLHMKLSGSEDRVMSELAVPGHLCGWGNMVHGGIITTLLDETMSWAAIHLLRKMILTRTMEIEFVLPVPPNVPIRTEGWIQHQVKSTEAIVEAALYNGDDQVCARSTGHFALLNAKLMRRMKIMDEETIAAFEQKYEPSSKG